MKTLVFCCTSFFSCFTWLASAFPGKEGFGGVEVAGGEAAENAGDEGCGEAEEEEEEGEFLEIKLGEVKQLREAGVVFPKEFKVVILLDHHCIEDN